MINHIGKEYKERSVSVYESLCCTKLDNIHYFQFKNFKTCQPIKKNRIARLFKNKKTKNDLHVNNGNIQKIKTIVDTMEKETVG